MHIYATLILILCCVVKALLPSTSGWESFLLFAVSGGVYYIFSITLPQPEVVKELLTKVEALSKDSKETQDVAHQAKKIAHEMQMANTFVRRDKRVIP